MRLKYVFILPAVCAFFFILEMVFSNILANNPARETPITLVVFAYAWVVISAPGGLISHFTGGFIPYAVSPFFAHAFIGLVADFYNSRQNKSVNK